MPGEMLIIDASGVKSLSFRALIDKTSSFQMSDEEAILEVKNTVTKSIQTASCLMFQWAAF